MTKPWDSVGLEPWEVEIAHYVGDGANPYKARIAVILKWMTHGDLRPLAAAIKEEAMPLPNLRYWYDALSLDDGPPPTVPKEEHVELSYGAVLGVLARMIDDGRIKAVSRRRGRPRNLKGEIRNLVAALAYEQSSGAGNSEGRFDAAAEWAGTSHQTVRRAVTARRRRKRT